MQILKCTKQLCIFKNTGMKRIRISAMRSAAWKAMQILKCTKQLCILKITCIKRIRISAMRSAAWKAMQILKCTQQLRIFKSTRWKRSHALTKASLPDLSAMLSSSPFLMENRKINHTFLIEISMQGSPIFQKDRIPTAAYSLSWPTSCFQQKLCSFCLKRLRANRFKKRCLCLFKKKIKESTLRKRGLDFLWSRTQKTEKKIPFALYLLEEKRTKCFSVEAWRGEKK